MNNIKIYKLIQILQKIKKEHGNVPCVMADFRYLQNVVFDKENKCVILTDE